MSGGEVINSDQFRDANMMSQPTATVDNTL